jgi:hypothetical protein
MFSYNIDNAIPPDYPYYNTLSVCLDRAYGGRPKRFAVSLAVVEVAVLILERDSTELLPWLRGSDFQR